MLPSTVNIRLCPDPGWLQICKGTQKRDFCLNHSCDLRQTGISNVPCRYVISSIHFDSMLWGSPAAFSPSTHLLKPKPLSTLTATHSHFEASAIFVDSSCIHIVNNHSWLSLGPKLDLPRSGSNTRGIWRATRLGTQIKRHDSIAGDFERWRQAGETQAVKSRLLSTFEESHDCMLILPHHIPNKLAEELPFNTRHLQTSQ